MAEEYELEFIKSMFEEKYIVEKTKIEPGRVAALFEHKAKDFKVIHYADMVLDRSETFSNRYKSQTFDRLYKWIND